MMTVPSPTLFAPSPRGLSSPVFLNPAASPPPSLPPPPPDILAVLSRIDEGGREELCRLRSTKDQMMLKRKRPMKIEIPTHIGVDDFKTTPSDTMGNFEYEGEGYSVCCKKGRRSGLMEDRYAVNLGTEGDSKQAFFAVFDGHGGPKAAEFAAKNLEKNIMLEISKRNDCTEEAVRKGYLATDAEFISQGIYGGTCVVTAIMDKGDLIVSNAGDCRAVMSRGGIAEVLTVDHKPSLEEERDRILRTGGLVLDCGRGVWRVDGSLATSRAIGDSHLKEWVIAEPETRVVKIRSECEFLILGSDGLWDAVGNQEAVDVVRSFCVGVEKRMKSLSACKKLVDLSVERGSIDDITVMVIEQLSR